MSVDNTPSRVTRGPGYVDTLHIASAVVGGWQQLNRNEPTVRANEAIRPIFLWSADYPDCVPSPILEIAQVHRYMDDTIAVLDGTEQRFPSFIRAVQQRSVELTFSPEHPLGSTTPEAEVASLLGELTTLPVSFGTNPSFGPSEGLSQRWQGAIQEFKALLHEVRGHLTRYGLVETRVRGTVVGRTTLGLTGNMETSFVGGLKTEELQLHRDTVRLALASRATTLRTFAVVLQGAGELAKLGILLSIPGGTLLTLPVAYRFVQGVLKEAQQD